MREVTFEDVRTMATESAEDLQFKARSRGHDVKIYLHWTAGTYDRQFDDYHINIDGDGVMYTHVGDFAQYLPHTEGRNPGAVGIALDCAFRATPEDLGDYPPTEKQIETCAKLVAILTKAFEIPIDKAHVMTHGEAADNEDGMNNFEPYGMRNDCERWDLEVLGTDESPMYLFENGDEIEVDGCQRGGDVLRNKAIWYAQNE